MSLKKIIKIKKMKDIKIQTENCCKTKGVWGQEKPRCPELSQVIHCRNCEVFTQAGRNLLERELPEEYLNEWTRVFAAKKEDKLLGTIAVVVFRLEKEWLALPAQLFAEIIQVERAHSIPHRNNKILMGIVNVHGEIQLCVSLTRLLGIETTYDKEKDSRRVYKRMMVVNRDSERWVFLVDEIEGIYRVHPNILQNVPVTVSKSNSAFTKGLFKWQDKYVSLLDDELLLYKLTRSVQ